MAFLISYKNVIKHYLFINEYDQEHS